MKLPDLSMRRSIVLKLNAPIVIFGSILMVAIYCVLQFEAKRLEKFNANNLAQLFVDSVVIGAEVNGSDANIIRLVNALSSYREVTFVSLVDDASRRVIAASKNQYIGSDVSEVDSLRYLAKTLESQSRSSQLNYLNEGYVYQFVKRIQLYDPKTKAIRNIWVALTVNVKSLNIASSRAIAITGAAVAVAFILLIVLFVFVQRYVLLRRLGDLRYIISTEMKADGFVSMNITKGDELDRIKYAFLDLLWTRKRIAKNLEEALVLAEKSNKAKTDFLANMSHELRTPLNSIIGFSYRLIKKSDNFDEKQIKSLDIINKNGHHLKGLINDILDLSKIDAGRMDIELKNIELPIVCEQVVEQFSDQAIEKGLTIDLDYAGKIFAEVDELRFRQIIINLLSNAIKYTHTGSIVVSLQESGSGYVDMAVRDTGIGIKEEDKQRLFKRFEQFDENSRFQVGFGTGLGLSIVGEFVKLHGGHVSVESEFGRGSCFTASFPLKGPSL